VPAVRHPMPGAIKHTFCGADPAAVSITFALNRPAQTVDVVGTVKNIGNAPQAASRVQGLQFAQLYAIGFGQTNTNRPIARALVPPLAVNQEVTVHSILRYPLTGGDVPPQFRLEYLGDADRGDPRPVDCDIDNNQLTVTADKKPLYPLGTGTYP
jgi:hypothetical protein